MPPFGRLFKATPFGYVFLKQLGVLTAGARCVPVIFLLQDIVHMTTGTVKFFDTTRGFGFIKPEDGSKDVFVHISAVERSGLGTLNEGQRVSFEVKQDTRGPKAINLEAA